MNRNEKQRIAEALAVGIAIFALAIVLPKLVLDGAAPTLAAGRTMVWWVGSSMS